MINRLLLTLKYTNYALHKYNKTIRLSNTKDGQVIIKAGELSPGTYSYSLIVNNQPIITKKMIIHQERNVTQLRNNNK